MCRRTIELDAVSLVWQPAINSQLMITGLPHTCITHVSPKMQHYSLISLPKTRARGSKTWSFHIEKRLIYRLMLDHPPLNTGGKGKVMLVY